MPWLTADPRTEEVEAARDIVLRRLDRSAVPRAALASLLERKDVDPSVAAEVLDRLEAAGVVDDQAYAATLARTRFAEKGVARRAVAEELRRKGVEEAAVSCALEQITPEDEEAAALRLARRRAATMTDLPTAVCRRRLIAYLGRKGYGRELSLRAVALAVPEAGDDSEEELA
ncbi:regulatory protein RecX [Actinomyces sp. 2119]|uniref:regulatory protein RecX n=1 Tax=Actinomyces sp. 2119 TaxID=2321393 RepID=UPI000E6D4876|nr:regulatory protein RecX [Actinomyces sp. 2119]RJF42569.1 regulatory protein RecX [Actinomyces sp. 2119]